MPVGGAAGVVERGGDHGLAGVVVETVGERQRAPGLGARGVPVAADGARECEQVGAGHVSGSPSARLRWRSESGASPRLTRSTASPTRSQSAE